MGVYKGEAPVNERTGFWVLSATILASSMAFFDGSSLNVALAALQADLGASAADLLWIVNAYALMLGALMLVGGALGDHYGRRRIFGIGIVGFLLTSLLCGLAPDTGTLIAARAVRGAAGALMVPGSLAILSSYFDDSSRGRAFGTWSALTTLATIAGPFLGGILADAGLWRGIFFFSIPLGVGALWALLRYVPESRSEVRARGLDWPGAVLATLGLAVLTYGFIELGRQGAAGLADPLIPLAVGAGCVVLGLFVFVEARSPNPMMPLHLFRSRTFSGANLLTLFMYSALYGSLFFMPLNLIQVQGYNALQAGMALVPISILLALMSRWAGGLVDRYGPRLPLVAGSCIAGFGYVGLALPGQTGGPGDYWLSYFPGLLLLGVGLGVVVAPLVTAVMGSVPQHNAGVASGINSAVARSAQALATAMLGGLALLLFSHFLLGAVEPLALPDAALASLQAEAPNFGNAAVPEGLTPVQGAAVADAVAASFVQAFQLIMVAAAALCWVSSLCALVVIEGRIKNLPQTSAGTEEVPSL